MRKVGKYENNSKSRSNFVSAVAFCLFLLWEASPFYTTVRLISSLLPSFISILSCWIGKNILDMLSESAKLSEIDAVWPVLYFVLLLFGLSIVNAWILRAGQYAQAMHEDIIRGKLSYYMMELSCKIDLEYFDNCEYYDKLLLCNQDLSVIQELLWDLLNGISALLSVAMASLILCHTNLYYGVFMLVATIPSSVIGIKYTRQLYCLNLDQINGERQKSYLQNVVMERRFAQSIRFYQCGALLCNRFQYLWKQLFDTRRKVNRRRVVWTSSLECMPLFVEVGISIDIICRIFTGLATIGDYSLYTGLTTELTAGVALLTYSIMQIYDKKLKINNLRQVHNFSNHIQDTGKECLRSIQSIEFVNVCFTYPQTNKKVLNNISFKIGPNEKVALVGLNGSGKSTIIKLILRFYEIDSGNIYINGINIGQYSISELRRNFSVYFQDEPSFSFTLRENVTIADPDHPNCDTAVREAFHASGNDDILWQAQNGLDTYLTRIFYNDGIELSGGQYQKLALARTFFRRHSALILDEASSNLDPRAEHELFNKLQDFTKGKVVLFTSHRLINVTLADRIIVLENGQVIEQGTQQELLKAGGRYAELFGYQQEHVQNIQHGGRSY